MLCPPQPDKYVVKAEVPGVKKDDIKLSVENGQPYSVMSLLSKDCRPCAISAQPRALLCLLAGVLTITAEKKDQHEERKVRQHNSTLPHTPST